MQFTVPNCEECDHRRVCKRKKVTRIVIEEVNIIVSLHENDNGINISLECEEFRAAVN